MAGQRIVVGIDGSEPSRAALQWAIGQAKATDAELHAVIGWEYPPAYELGAVITDSYEVFKDAAEETLGKTLTEVAGLQPGVEITSHVVQGHPASALLDAANDASLLVVGSRGRGGFAGLLLGSVSAQCVQHAPCPVVVVRVTHRPEPGHEP